MGREVTGEGRAGLEPRKDGTEEVADRDERLELLGLRAADAEHGERRPPGLEGGQQGGLAHGGAAPEVHGGDQGCLRWAGAGVMGGHTELRPTGVD